eukprot:TRINITY_DN1876_c0_g1_i2.p1 TRINITY_DN1876_c0_g1~~TRINITY_DN1876_c0_g1_i2.p1  ORF type:complete len:213 (+),score=26.82 TRINITY_DN1876_c0_g1_i2:195-833(+)
MRQRQDVSYVDPNIVKGLPYSEMPGTTSQALQCDVREVFVRIDELTRGPCAEARRRELLSSLANTDDFRSVIQPAPELNMLSRGITAQIAALRSSSHQHSTYGRIANNVLMAAVAGGIDSRDREMKDGRIDRLATLVGVNRATLWRAHARLETTEMVAPHRRRELLSSLANTDDFRSVIAAVAQRNKLAGQIADTLQQDDVVAVCTKLQHRP